MTKTTKISAIFFITTLWLVIMRIVFSFLNLSDNISEWLFSLLMQIVGMGAIPMLLFKFWVKEDIVTGLSLKVKIPPLTYVLAVPLGCLVSFASTGVGTVFRSILLMLGYKYVNGPSTIYSDVWVLVMEIFTTAMLPAVFEEITDRGLVMRMFRDVDNEKLVIVLMAALFGLAHQNIGQTGYTFAAGLVFAYLALKTKSILPGMIIHFINNFNGVISGYSDQHNGIFARVENAFYAYASNHVLISLIIWAASVALIVVILKYIAKIQPKENVEAKEGDMFFFPNKLQYVDDLFGSGLKKETAKLSTNAKPYWYEYAFMYGAMVMMALTTLSTFIWGIWR